MNRFAWVVVALSCAAPLGAEQVQVFTPSNTGDAPVYMNGDVVRIDRSAGTFTVRGSDGQRTVFTLDRATLDASAQLRPGARVIVGYRTTGSGADARRIVSDLRSGSLVSGRVSTPAAGSSSGPQSMGVAQVVSVDATGRRLTVVDSNGTTRVLDVRGNAVARLGSLSPGDSITLGVAAPLVSGTPAGTVTSIGAPSTNSNMAREASSMSGRATTGGTMDMNTGAAGGRTEGTNPTPTFTNDSLPNAPALPPSPQNGVSRNPAQTGVQPAPRAQPVPGVQGPTGVQPVPAAQPLPGTGVNGQSAANPGLNPQPVPGAGGKMTNNAGATGGTSTTRSSGVATSGAANAGAARNSAVTPSAVGATTVGVPQLGASTSAINSPIPSIPPTTAGGTTVVLPVPTVLPETNPPRTPAEVAAVRELGSRDFDAAIATLGVRAAEVDRAWAAYRASCVTSTVPLNNRSREWFGVLDGSIAAPTDDACEQAFAEVDRLARAVSAGLETARDTARRADVLPGRMREVQQRYNLDL